MSTKRLNIIKYYIRQNKKVHVSTLSKMLSVSETTIRSDLAQLELEGFVKRYHGGAILKEDNLSNIISTIDEADPVMMEKSYIADVAAEIIEDRDVIFLGHGYSCWQIAKRIKKKQNLSVVTNNIYVLYELSCADNIDLVITGGNVQKREGSVFLTGIYSLNVLEKILINKAFISPLGVSMSNGYTIDDEDQLELYNKVKNVADELIILADYSKFNKTYMISFLPINSGVKIITNENIPFGYKEFFNKNSIQFYNTI